MCSSDLKWANQLFLSLQAELVAAGIPCRFHWGQFHQLDRAAVLHDYGAKRVAAFESIRQDFDPTGVLGSRVGDRLGWGG